MNTENNVIVLNDEGGLQELKGSEVLTAWRTAKLDYKPAYIATLEGRAPNKKNLY